jgi:hypothetical protein
MSETTHPAETDDWELADLLGWQYLGQTGPTRPGRYRTPSGEIVYNTREPLVSTGDVAAWLKTRQGQVHITSEAETWQVVAGDAPAVVAETLDLALRRTAIAVATRD